MSRRLYREHTKKAQGSVWARMEAIASVPNQRGEGEGLGVEKCGEETKEPAHTLRGCRGCQEERSRWTSISAHPWRGRK